MKITFISKQFHSSYLREYTQIRLDLTMDTKHTQTHTYTHSLTHSYTHTLNIWVSQNLGTHNLHS